MDREFIKAPGGDRQRRAVDIYDWIDREELGRAYLAFTPQLGLGIPVRLEEIDYFVSLLSYQTV